MICLVSDSQAAIQTVHNLSKGRPPVPTSSAGSKEHSNPRQETGILWAKGHICIPGNEKADRKAEFESILGEISGKNRIATEEGVRARSRATRKVFHNPASTRGPASGTGTP